MCQQCETAWSWLEASLSNIRGGDGKKHFTQFRSPLTVAFQTGLASSLSEKLADHILDGHFLDIDVADMTSFQQLSASLGDFRSWDFQLHRQRRLFDHLTER